MYQTLPSIQSSVGPVIRLYPALSHGQSLARQQPPFALRKKRRTISLGFMVVLQQALTSPKGAHKTLRKTECEQ